MVKTMKKTVKNSIKTYLGAPKTPGPNSKAALLKIVRSIIDSRPIDDTLIPLFIHGGHNLLQISPYPPLYMFASWWRFLGA